MKENSNLRVQFNGTTSTKTLWNVFTAHKNVSCFYVAYLISNLLFTIFLADNNNLKSADTWEKKEMGPGSKLRHLIRISSTTAPSHPLITRMGHAYLSKIFRHYTMYNVVINKKYIFFFPPFSLPLAPIN